MQPEYQHPPQLQHSTLSKKWLTLIVLASVVNIGFLGMSFALGMKFTQVPALTGTSGNDQRDEMSSVLLDEATDLELKPFRNDYVRVSMSVPKEFSYVNELDGDNAIIAFTGITIEPDVVKDDTLSGMSYGRSIEVTTGQIKEQIVIDNTDYGIFLASAKKQVKATVEESRGSERVSSIRAEREIEINGLKAYEAEVENRYMADKDSDMDSVDRLVYIYVSNESDYSFKFTSYYNDASFQRSTDKMVGSIRIE